MFRNRVVFYDLLLQSHKVSCWHKRKELTYFLSSAVYHRGHRRSAQSCTSFTWLRKAFWFCWQRLWREIMEKIKTPIMIFFFFFSGKALLPYDRLYDKWHIWKSVVVEDVMISWAGNGLTWPFFSEISIVWSPDAVTVFDAGNDIKWWWTRSTSQDVFFIQIF